MKKITIKAKINGEQRTLEVQPMETLLEVLRETLGLKSPKCGCDRGDCGTCTVLYDGRAVRSCLILAPEADGREIETLEGICRDGLTPLQKKMHELNAFQCGFCAPGMIVSATELLRRNKKPSEGDIKEAIGGNLCRCTGYEPIIDAVKAVSGKGRR